MALLKAGSVGVIGAGIVLLVCRYALLPITDDWKWLQYVGIGAIVFGGIGVRTFEAEEVRKPLLVLSGLAGAVLAALAYQLVIKPTPASEVELVERRYPGVIVKLPADKPVIEQTETATARIKMERIGGSRGMLELGWQSGHTEMSGEQIADLIRSVIPGKIGAVESRETVVSTHSGKAIKLPVNDTAIYISTWYCDQHDRDFTLTTMVLESLAKGREFHDRIADSVQCHVGDKPAIAVRRPLFAVPSTYGFMPDSDPPSFLSLDGDELAAQVIPPEMARQVETRPELILKIFEIAPEVTNARIAGEVKTLARDSSERLVRRVQFEEAGALGHASVTTVACDDAPSFLVLHNYEIERQAAAEEVLVSTVCHDGGKDQTFAPASQVFGNACDAKDGRGCFMMAVLEGSAASPNQESINQHLKRGCDAEHGDSCNELGVILEESAPAEAKTLYTQACKLGSATGCTNTRRLLDAAEK